MRQSSFPLSACHSDPIKNRPARGCAPGGFLLFKTSSKPRERPADIAAAPQRQAQQGGSRRTESALHDIPRHSRHPHSQTAGQECVIQGIARHHHNFRSRSAHRCPAPGTLPRPPVSQRRQQSHEGLDDQSGRHIGRIACQQICQGRTDPAGQGPPCRSQQVRTQQHHRISQIQISAGGRGNPQYHGRRTAQGRQSPRLHQHARPVLHISPRRLPDLLHLRLLLVKGFWLP